MYDFMDMGFDDPIPAQSASGPYIPEARDCQRCGMCVSGCPTFELFRIEAESPRSRVRSLARLLQDDQAIGEEERLHLQNCLQCRACEVVCPSHMEYGQLFDQALSKLPVHSGWLANLAFRLIADKALRMRLLPLLRLYLRTGLSKLVRLSGLLHKTGLAAAEALLVEPALQAVSGCYPPGGKTSGRVALFTGCLAEHFDRPTLLAAIKLLNAIGYEVLIPAEQGCCGAIHQHNGRSATALMANNISVFNSLPVYAVLHTASGCGAMLSEYQSDENADADQFRQRLYDINQFLLDYWPDELKLLPASHLVAVHEPCSQRNVLKNQQSVYSLLEKIPETRVVALADNQLCCGAGGSYMLTHPENADRLRALKLQAIRAAAADYIVSSNYGCATFLGSDQHKLVHPLILLAKQLPAD